jgi:hypothetical protein
MSEPNKENSACSTQLLPDCSKKSRVFAMLPCVVCFGLSNFLTCLSLSGALIPRIVVRVDVLKPQWPDGSHLRYVFA